jgi:hypothetical protein
MFIIKKSLLTSDLILTEKPENQQCFLHFWKKEGEGNICEIVVYDNGMDQTIGGGNIVVHKSKYLQIETRRLRFLSWAFFLSRKAAKTISSCTVAS